jgi:hypothetical protein
MQMCILPVWERGMGRPARHADFFRVWTPEMAYVLGYWWADGSMRVKSNTGAYEISIGSNYPDHLETIGRIIGQKYYLGKVSAESQTYSICFCSKEMYQDIQAHGGTPRKSRTIGFPYVPPELFPHFVRGVVDGDGTVSWNGDRPVLHIYSGSQPFLRDLAIAVEHATGIPAPCPRANRENWYVKWSTTRAKCLAAWLYVQHPGLSLSYKAEEALQFLSWQPKRKPNAGTITNEMLLHFGEYFIP